MTFSFVTEEIPDSNWILRKQTSIINLFFCYCIYSSRPTYIFQLESFIIILDNLTAKSHLHFLLCCFLVIFYIFFRLPIDIFSFVRYYNINKRKGGRTTNQLNLYLKFKERGIVQCRGQFKLKRF